MIKGSIQEEDITIDIYAPNIGAPQSITQTLTHTRNIEGKYQGRYKTEVVCLLFNHPISKWVVSHHGRTVI